LIKINDFKKGDIYYYSDFYDKSYCRVEAIKITSRMKRRPHYLFNARIVDNSHIDKKEYYEIGSIHSFSNSFMFKSLKELKGDIERYKEVQCNYLKKIVKRIDRISNLQTVNNKIVL